MLRDHDYPEARYPSSGGVLEDEQLCVFDLECSGCGRYDCSDPDCWARAAADKLEPCGGCYGCLRDGGCSGPVCRGCGERPYECACHEVDE